MQFLNIFLYLQKSSKHFFQIHFLLLIVDFRILIALNSSRMLFLYVWLHLHVCAYMCGGQWTMSNVMLKYYPPYIFGLDFLLILNSPTQQDLLSSKPKDGSVSTFPPTEPSLKPFMRIHFTVSILGNDFFHVFLKKFPTKWKFKWCVRFMNKYSFSH